MDKRRTGSFPGTVAKAGQDSPKAKRLLAAGKGLLLLGLAAAVLSGCDAMFFYPQKNHVATPYLRMFRCEDRFFTAEGGVRLHGWLIHPSGRPRGTVLYLHGNAENISTYVGSVLWLALSGYRVFLFDYRGYGRSEGTPDIEGIHADASAAMDEAAAIDAGAEGDGLIVLGHSLGGSVAVYVVATSPHRDRVKALIIDSTFSGYRSIARDKFAWNVLLWPLRHPLTLFITDRFSARRWIDGIAPIPLVIIHGDADTVVPVRHGQELFRYAGEPKELWILPRTGHIMSFANAGVRTRLLGFLDTVLGNNAIEGSRTRHNARKGHGGSMIP